LQRSIKNETPKKARGDKSGNHTAVGRNPHTEAKLFLRDAAVPGGFGRHSHVSRWRPDWLADDAVSCELVSAPNSLLTGKLTGNFAESLALCYDFDVQSTSQFKGLPPNSLHNGTGNFCSHNREFFRDNREFNRASSESAELLSDVELARLLMSTPGTSAA